METGQQEREKLAALVKHHQDLYYNGEAEISDAEFDALWDELAALDPGNPLFSRVGADSGNFPKATHLIPMGSQEKAATPDDFLAWAAKHRYDEYLVEYKLDGASLELQYREGVLTEAVTRGDGTVGDVITGNAKKMRGVLERLETGGNLWILTGGVRGEVLMTREVHRSFFADKANCRNAANGLMKRKDGEGAEHLLFVAYDAFFPAAKTETAPFADEVQKMAWLKTLGFTTAPLKVCKTPEEVVQYREAVAKKRDSLDYDIDGLVVKERNIDPLDMQRLRPDRQIAFKFETEKAVSVLRSVEWSESGATYTPIALFDPVRLGGTMVKRASLVNPATIRKLGVKIGSAVLVTKRGEIIPKIEAVVQENPANPLPSSPQGGGTAAAQEIDFPAVCSVCGTSLADEGTRLFCPNPACPKRLHHRLEKWAAVMDLRDLGDVLLKGLFGSGRVSSVSDLYTLTVEDLTPFFLESAALSREKTSKGAAKVHAVLQTPKTVSLSQFVAAFDIENIGELLMERLTDSGFDTLEKLLDAPEEEIAAVKGFGEITAKTLKAGLTENSAEMRQLLSSGRVTIRPATAKGEAKLEGKSFCFTGEMALKRADAERLVKENGGTVKSAVTKDLTYLVTRDRTSGSAKNEKARKLGIAVIDEAEFRRML